MIKKYDDTQISELADILNNDGVISVPTDTVYGLCCKIDSKIAKEKLINIKERPKEKSFPVMCLNKEQIEEIAVVTPIASKIINAFMPGPLTIVLHKKENILDYVTNGKDTIAIRMSTSNAIYNLIKNVNSPIFMTSANKSGMPTCKTPEEIEKACPSLDAIMIGTPLFGKASTIIDATSDKIKILREGPITLEQLEAILL